MPSQMAALSERSSLSLPTLPSGGSTINSSTTTNFAPVVNVQVAGSSGNQQADEEHAQRIGAAVRDQLKSLVTSEIRLQQRPGGLLNGTR